MEDTCKDEATTKENLVVQIKTKKRPRFKAGAELSGAVNLISVDVNENSDKESETLELTVQIQREFRLLSRAYELEK